MQTKNSTIIYRNRVSSTLQFSFSTLTLLVR